MDSALHFRKSGVFGRKAVFGVGWTLGRFGGFGRFCWFSRGLLSQNPPFSLYSGASREDVERVLVKDALGAAAAVVVGARGTDWCLEKRRPSRLGDLLLLE